MNYNIHANGPTRKNNIRHPQGIGYTIPLKYLLAMKLTVFFLLVFTLQAAAEANAQKINLQVKDKSLKSVMRELRKQSNFSFLYDDQLLAQAQRVTLDIKDMDLQEALPLIFENQPLAYKVDGKIISIISKKPAPIRKVRLLQDTISGTVTDSLGRPLAGVAVRIAGTKIGTNTNGKGQFTIPNSIDGAQVEFFLIGFAPLRLPSTNLPVNIILHESVSKLDETVVIAYGTTTQRLSTGSVSSVTAAEIENQPVSNPLSAIQGRVPGLVISQMSGVPGSSFRVQLRGQSALDLTLSQNDPLFIIDGVPFESGNSATNQIYNATNNPTSISSGGVSPLNTINPASIERIDVLKDADATAIYGSRGANGVIIITTKQGKRRGTEVSANVYSGFSQIGRSLDMLNLQQYIEMRKEAFANDGIAMTAANAPDIMLWDTTRYTDFKSLLIGNTATANNINLNVSGGNEQTRFRIGAGYRRETSVYSSSMSNNVASFSFATSHTSANDRLRINLSVVYGNDLNKLPRFDLTRYINVPPNLKLHNEDGSLAWSDEGVNYNTVGNGLENPLSFLEEQATSSNENISTNLALSYRILDGLVVKLNSGYNRFHTDEEATRPFAAINTTTNQLPSAVFANANNKSWIVEPQLQFDTGLADGNLSILIGATVQEKMTRGTYITGTNYSSDLLLTSIAAAGNISSRNNFSQYRYVAAFSRLNYNKDDKYIINLTGRRDGSSRFGPDKQWANFGAIGAAWVFSNEGFFDQESSIFSFGKLRSSYGITGNDQIGDYRFLNLWQNTPSTYDGIEGLYPTSLYNPDYNWEINRKFEVGLDLGFLNDNILLTGNYYINRSDNQLINYRLSGQTGFTSVVRNFPGLVQNSGLEVVLTSNAKFGQFNWSGSFNISLPRNKLLAFPNLENSSYASQYIIGKSLNTIQGYISMGVDFDTGIYTFEDGDGDGTLATTGRGDYGIFGNFDPTYFGGVQNNFRFKNWNLGFFFHFTKQLGTNYRRQLVDVPGFIGNQPQIVMERWRNPGDVSEIQKFTSTWTDTYLANAFFGLSNAAYTDASFVRLKNLSLSYNLSENWLRNIRIKQCRLYVEGQNLLTFSGYKGSDPETQNFYILPPLKTIAFGLQVDL